ncbi:MAG: membrane protein insertion efficiency factor YidD [Magnetovibrio sp.]|nr:membrane protein insertion efficiency factor YidD [Magnetovibrio sp.]
MQRLGAIAGTVLKGVVRAYQLLLSPVLAGNCRYHPTCSAYTLEAIDAYGPVGGSWLALKRILRCNPWAGSGFDPVPEKTCRHGDAAHAPSTIVSGGPAGP